MQKLRIVEKKEILQGPSSRFVKWLLWTPRDRTLKSSSLLAVWNSKQRTLIPRLNKT